MDNVSALRVIQGSGQGRRLLLTKERMVIGREDDVDFGFHDKKLSREHAELVRRDDAWQVRDLGSRNGTSLNGHRLGSDAVALRPGDRITLGLVELEFEPEGAAPASRLRVLDGPLAGREFVLDGRKVVLGRSAEAAEIALDDQAASRQNTELELRNDTWWVRDLDSRNGTDCDGARLPAGISAKLHSGARLRVGSSVVEFLDHRVEDRIGATLLGYQLLARIAAGPCGIIYRGRSAAGEVAVKLLDPVVAADAREALRFVNGGRAQARIQHPNVARVIGADVIDGQPLVVGELALGGSLADRIAKVNAPLPPEQVVVWARDAARGLQAAEEKGLVHRSLRPGNLLLDGDGAVAVADFGTGSAYVANAPHGGPPTHYLAPEEVAGKEGDSRSNQFSLGCIIYHALTGRAPFNAVDREATAWGRHDQVLPAIQAANPMVAGDVAKVCARLLARAPEHRYPGWAEAASDLDALVRGAMPTTVSLPGGQSALAPSLPSSRLATAASSVAPASPSSAEGSGIAPPSVSTSQRITVPPIAVKGLILLALVIIIGGFVLPALNRSVRNPAPAPATPKTPSPTPSDGRQAGPPRVVSPSEMILRQQEADDRARAASLDGEPPAPAAATPVAVPEPVAAPVVMAPAPAAPAEAPPAADESGPAPMLRPQIVALFAVGGPGNQYIRQVGIEGTQAWGKGAGFAVAIDLASGAATVSGDIATDDGDPWDWKLVRDPKARTELKDPRNGFTYTIGTVQVHPILQQPLLTSTAGWKLWGWTHAQVADEYKNVRGGPLMADSRGCDLWLMPGGNLGVLCWTDGGNSVLTRDPRDLSKPNDAAESPGSWRASPGGMASLFLLVDAKDGTPRSGTFVRSPVTERAVDPWGRVYLPRAQDGAMAVAGATDNAGGGLFVLAPDLHTAELNARLGGGAAEGGQEGFATLALHGNILVLGGTTNSTAPPAIHGIQPKPGGGQDGFICVVKLW
jgi:serine/threonine-protein kinase